MTALKSKPDLVFIATRVPYPPVTGHHVRTFNILRGLADKFSIHLFAFWDKHITESEHRAAESVFKGICASIHFETVAADRSKARLLIDLGASLLTGRPFTASKYLSRTMRRAIREAVVTHDVVLVHADSLQSAQYLIGVTAPKLLTNHNVEYRRLLTYASRQRRLIVRLALTHQALLTKSYERRMVVATGNCVVVSECDQKDLSNLAPSARYYLVHNGTDTSFPALPPPNPAILAALWVGGMNDSFNRDAVLHFASRILPRIRAEIPGFRWLVVGRDPPITLRTLASDPGSGVDLAGFLPTVREAYERSTIVVVPLLSGGGTKLKVLEAMAMGRAVVTTPIGAEGISATDTVEMEIAASDDEFAQRVIGLFRDPIRRDRIAAKARLLAERDYAWEVVNRQMYSAVQSVMRNHGRADATTACAR